jgi:hypothetical protein
MENKTAMMVMIQGIDTASKLYISKGLDEANKALIPIRSLADKLLKEEKEQMIEAVNYGNRQEAYDATEEIGNFYYNQNYINEQTDDK